MDAHIIKMLAIDNNQDNLTTLKAVVSDALPGYVLLTALSGQQGIDLARTENPDVILLDIIMPGMDGFEVCRRLKADEMLRSIPVVFLTAMRADRESRVKALEAGAEAFLAKPLDEFELVAQVRAMVKIKAANRLQRLEKEQLTALVAERTSKLEQELTERKRAEEQQANLQAQLNHAQKMESVGRLAGGVAHDFNNMLQIIMGNMGLVLDKMDPDNPIRPVLEEVQSAGKRAADLTRQLLAFARKQTVTPRTIYLNETVESMLKMLRRLIGENIELVWEPFEGLWTVRMDPVQIDQILANLCVNAHNAIDGVGAVHISTRNARVDEFNAVRHEGFLPGDYVLLTVSDTGCGMDKATQSRIFEPFFTTKDAGKGTGMGLATVYGIVRQNQGYIDVYSEPGKGTTFRIYLPRYMGNDAAQCEDATVKPITRGCETVLLVEDEPAILYMTTTMLVSQGYTVLAASRPGEAIRLAEAHSGKIHLLLTDVVMPEMNGNDLAGNLLVRYPHLKCLFMSGFTADVIARHGVLDKGMHFIQKPFSMEDLSAKMREALEGE